MAEVNTAHPIRTEPGHELSDLSPRTMLFFGIGLAALILAVLMISYGAMAWLRSSAGQRAEAPSPLSITQEPLVRPQLLVEPGLAMKTLRQQEEARLKSYGWIDQDRGIAHIPIDRAIDMLANQGLPARPRQAQTAGESRAAKEAGARLGEPER